MSAGTPRQEGAVPDAEARQDLRHLGRVAEHVGEVADGHRASETRARGAAELEVADDRLAVAANSSRRMRNGPTLSCSRSTSATNPVAHVRAHLEVVLDRRGLSVEREPVLRLRLEDADQPVEHVHQRRRNTSCGSYHSRSQWVWGTTTISLVTGGDS